MKDKSYLWIWCLINTISLILILIIHGISSDVESIQDEKIDRIETDVNSIKFAMEFQPDTVVVNISNNVNIPSTVKVSLK